MRCRCMVLLCLIFTLCLLSGCGARESGNGTPTVAVQTTVATVAAGVRDATPVTATTIERDHPTATPAIQEADIPEGITPIASIYNEDIPATRAERIIISEVFLMLEAGQLLVETEWDGDNNTPLPLTIDQFDRENLEATIEDEIQDDRDLTIPDQVTDLYVSDAGAEAVQGLIVLANGEFRDYLAVRGVLPVYLEELERVLPPTTGRMVYHPINDPNTEPTAVMPVEEPTDNSVDHSRLRMNVYAVDIYNRALLLENSRILGEPPTDGGAYHDYHLQLRDMAARQLVWHEMTHALQRAYLVVHIENEADRVSASWVYATKTLADSVDTQYHWVWGDPYFAEAYNTDVSGESQAEGISYELLVTLYDMSATQKAAVWDHYFGRLEASRDALREAKEIFEREYPTFSPDDIGVMLGEVMNEYPDSQDAYRLWQVTFRLIALPAYVGYLNPMEPQDTPKFWEALRQP